MTERSIDQRTGDAFGASHADGEDVRFYLGRLIDVSHLAERRAYGGIGSIVALSAFFLLFSTQNPSEAELFGIKVQEFSFFLLAIPVAVAFLFARTVAMFNSLTVYRAAYVGIAARRFERWHSSGLDQVLLNTPGQLSGSVDEQFFAAGRGRRIYSFSSGVELIFFLCAPTAFTAAAYYSLFSLATLPPAYVAISMALSVLLLSLGWLQFLFVHAYVV